MVVTAGRGAEAAVRVTLIVWVAPPEVMLTLPVQVWLEPVMGMPAVETCTATVAVEGEAFEVVPLPGVALSQFAPQEVAVADAVKVVPAVGLVTVIFWSAGFVVEPATPVNVRLVGLTVRDVTVRVTGMFTVLVGDVKTVTPILALYVPA
jgi:hypothetical protein